MMSQRDRMAPRIQAPQLALELEFAVTSLEQPLLDLIQLIVSNIMIELFSEVDLQITNYIPELGCIILTQKFPESARLFNFACRQKPLSWSLACVRRCTRNAPRLCAP